MKHFTNKELKKFMDLSAEEMKCIIDAKVKGAGVLLRTKKMIGLLRTAGNLT